MNKRIQTLLALCALALAPALALAAGGAGVLHSGADVGNTASLQRGATLFMNYCAGCHSLQYQRYSRLGEDLGLSEEQVMQNLNFAGVNYGEQIKTGIGSDGDAWFGKAPPDLSLTARSRGADWIYTYLKSFYVDESRPLGWNNTLFPGASMPHVLWELQGIQQPVMAEAEAGAQPHIAKLELAVPGQLDAAGYDQAARDITTFLLYVGEPAALERKAIGLWVVLFLALFTLLAYVLKHEYWRDVH